RGRAACPGERNRAHGRRPRASSHRQSSAIGKPASRPPDHAGMGGVVARPLHARQCVKDRPWWTFRQADGTERPSGISRLMPPRPTIAFDLDGTLVDTAPDLLAALNFVLGEEGLEPIEEAQVRNLVGAGARVMIERGLAFHRVPSITSDVD